MLSSNLDYLFVDQLMELDMHYMLVEALEPEEVVVALDPLALEVNKFREGEDRTRILALHQQFE